MLKPDLVPPFPHRVQKGSTISSWTTLTIMIVRVPALLGESIEGECAPTAQILLGTLASRFAVTEITADQTTFVTLDGHFARSKAEARLLQRHLPVYSVDRETRLKPDEHCVTRNTSVTNSFR